MFDLVTGQVRHIPRHNAVPLLISSLAEAAALTLVVAIPVLLVATRVPDIPTIMAFVATAPPPPAPPPPAAPKGAQASRTQQAVASGPVIPIEAPSEIKPELPGPLFDDGVEGGVEGGVPGGIVGGVVGTIVEAPPPPPPPAPVHQAPVRIAGELKAPALITRVEPVYPPIAVASQVAGVVILEATVDEHGQVENVRVLRSVHPILDREATAAVRQWRYSPLILNGHVAPFILTVTLSFSLQNAR